MSGTLYVIDGSTHDQLEREGAAEVGAENNADIATVATNIEAVKTVATAIGSGTIDSIPDAVAAATAAKLAAEAAAAAAVGIDEAAQGYALDAQTAAGLASAHAEAAAESMGTAQQTAEGVQDALADAQVAATLAERWANELPGIEVAAGKYGSPHYIAMHESLLATAPNLQFREFGTHAGEAGTNGVTQEFNNTAADFGRGIAINRLVNRPCKLKLLAGLYNGPPAEGADLSMVPIVITNLGADDCTIEGPTAGSIVLEPAVIASGGETLHSTTLTQVAATATVSFDIPAGTNRRFFAVQGIIYHSLPGSGVPSLSCSAVSSTVTQRDQVGDGLNSGSTPIKATIWSGTIPDGAALTGIQFQFNVPEFWASRWHHVIVVQNAAGVEDYDLVQRAGAATTETFTGLSPSVAESMAIVVAMHQGDPAHPVTITPNSSLTQGDTPSSRALKDFAYAVAVHSDRPASGLSYEGSSAHSSPAVIGGLVFTPVTSSVGSGALLWNGTPPAVLEPGNTATVWALSDGLRYYLDMQP